MLGSLAKSRAGRSVERPRTRNSRDWTGGSRQRSDCCISGTSSCQNEASASAGRRAGAVGGPVVGRPRWPRILSITGFSSMKAMTLRRPPQGQARMSSRKTRRSSSFHGMRESSGRGVLVAGGGRDVAGASLEHGAWAGHVLPEAQARSPCATSRPARRRRGIARGEPAAAGPAWRDGGATRAAQG